MNPDKERFVNLGKLFVIVETAWFFVWVFLSFYYTQRNDAIRTAIAMTIVGGPRIALLPSIIGIMGDIHDNCSDLSCKVNFKPAAAWYIIPATIFPYDVVQLYYNWRVVGHTDTVTILGAECAAMSGAVLVWGYFAFSAFAKPQIQKPQTGRSREFGGL